MLSGGYSFKVIIGLIRHSYFYKTHLAQRYPHVSKGGYLELFSFDNSKKYIMMLLRNSPFRIFTDNPLMLPCLYSIFFITPFDLWSKWLIVGPILVLLISTRSLSFLGEPERYLEFVVIPLFICLSFISFKEINIYAYLAFLGLILVLFFHFLTNFFNKPNFQQEDELVALRDYFKDIQNKTILTIPFRLSFFLGYQNISNRYVTLFSNIGKGKAGDHYRWLIKDRYPFVRNDLKSVISKFSVDYIVVHKPDVENMNKTFLDGYYDFSSYSIVYENSLYSVLKANK